MLFDQQVMAVKPVCGCSRVYGVVEIEVILHLAVACELWTFYYVLSSHLCCRVERSFVFSVACLHVGRTLPARGDCVILN